MRRRLVGVGMVSCGVELLDGVNARSALLPGTHSLPAGGAVELTRKKVAHSVVTEAEAIGILVFVLWAGLIADDGSSGLES
jgi:hypothetical protein